MWVELDECISSMPAFIRMRMVASRLCTGSGSGPKRSRISTSSACTAPPISQRQPLIKAQPLVFVLDVVDGMKASTGNDDHGRGFSSSRTRRAALVFNGLAQHRGIELEAHRGHVAMLCATQHIARPRGSPGLSWRSESPRRARSIQKWP